MADLHDALLPDAKLPAATPETRLDLLFELVQSDKLQAVDQLAVRRPARVLDPLDQGSLAVARQVSRLQHGHLLARPGIDIEVVRTV